MTTKPLVASPLSLAQTQHAAALDDLLRLIVFGGGGKWASIDKRMSKISYDGLYEIALVDAGEKASAATQVEWIERHFQKHDFTRQETAGVPNPVFKELIAAWKIRAKDDWSKVSLGLDETASTTQTTRVTASCDISTIHTGKPIKALNLIVLELDDSLAYDRYLEAGFSTRAMLQTEQFGAWNLLLGPGTALRKACSTCWNARSAGLASPAYTTWTLLCQNVSEGEELFAPAGKIGDSNWICPHPRHGELGQGWARKVPSDSLVSASRMPALPPTMAIPGTDASRASSSTPDTSAHLTPCPTTSKAFELPKTRRPSRLILRFPSYIRTVPISTRRLDLKVHRQIIRSHIQLKADRITKRVRMELAAARSKTEEAVLLAKKTRLEVNLAEARRARSGKMYERAKVAAKEACAREARMKSLEKELRADLEDARVAEEDMKKQCRQYRSTMMEVKKRNVGLDHKVAAMEQKLKTSEDRLETAIREARQTAQDEKELLKEMHAREMSMLRTEFEETAGMNWQVHRAPGTSMLEEQLEALRQQDAKLRAALQAEAIMRSQAEAVDQGLNGEVRHLQAIAAAGASSNGELLQARQRVDELQAEVDDTWSNFRRVQTELSRMKRASQHGMGHGVPQAAYLPSTAFQPDQHRQSGVHCSPVPSGTTSIPVGSFAPPPPAPTSIATARGFRQPMPTPPLTASPTGSHRTPSPGHFAIGPVNVGTIPLTGVGRG